MKLLNWGQELTWQYLWLDQISLKFPVWGGIATTYNALSKTKRQLKYIRVTNHGKKNKIKLSVLIKVKD